MGMGERELSALLQTASVTTVANVQLGSNIPPAHKRKITRIHVPADFPLGENRVARLFLGDVGDPTREFIDEFGAAAGNPDHTEQSSKLTSPIMTLRPDETQDPVQKNQLRVESESGDAVTFSITFYDERQ